MWEFDVFNKEKERTMEFSIETVMAVALGVFLALVARDILGVVFRRGQKRGMAPSQISGSARGGFKVEPNS